LRFNDNWLIKASGYIHACCLRSGIARKNGARIEA